MNKTVLYLFALLLFSGCANNTHAVKRVRVAEVGNVVLYYDDIPQLIKFDLKKSDSAAVIQNYINKWAKRELLLQKSVQGGKR
jgi:hypothetical protein